MFLGELRGKTRILVTHAVDFLHLVDTILIVKEGEVVLQGNYEEIKNEPYLIQLMEIHRAHKQEQEDMVKLAITKKKSETIAEPLTPDKIEPE